MNQTLVRAHYLEAVDTRTGKPWVGSNSDGRHPFWVDWGAIELRVFRYWTDRGRRPRELEVTRRPRFEGDRCFLEVKTERGVVVMIRLTRTDEQGYDWTAGAVFTRSRA